MAKNTNKKRIFGIDPGTSLIGYGIIDVLGQKYSAVDFGFLKTPANINNPDRVTTVYDFFKKLFKKHRPDAVAMESLFYFKNAKTVLRVSEIRGVLMLVAKHAHLEIREFTPLQVKQAVSAYGKADKKQVQRMVELIIGQKIPKGPDDVPDALAVAICCANQERF